MTVSLALVRNAIWIGGALALAALVHIAVILLVPVLMPIDAYTRFGQFEVERGFQALPAATPQAVALRFADPSVVSAICRYDLDQGGVIRITGRPTLAYWAVSLHNRTGLVYYAINNRGAGDRPLDLRVMDRDEITRLRADLPEAAEQSLLIAPPEPQGFALLRALVPTPNARARVEREVAGFTCELTD
jgi:uncharacterized membrane protein